MEYKDRINRLINSYRNNEEIYLVLKDYYINYEISEQEYTIRIDQIKTFIITYYGKKFDIISKGLIRYEKEKKGFDLIISIKNYYDLIKRIKKMGQKFRVYPVKIDNDECKNLYIRIVREMINYQIEKGIDEEECLDKLIKNLNEELNKLQDDLISLEMEPYYGDPAYLINRAKFVRKCLEQIPDVNVNIDEIIDNMDAFAQKHFWREVDVFGNYIFSDIDEQFYKDYDKLVEYYKMVIKIEDKLSSIVVNYWKQYLTDPVNHDDNHYRYLMHTFTDGLVAPEEMNKACCALNTDELIATPSGNMGLIYDIAEDCLVTSCTGDVGSWRCSKKDFIKRGCPITWQLTNPKGISVWYEKYENSKLIMPNIIEKECKERSISRNGEILNNSEYFEYSEIYLNENAKAVGAFYTDATLNVELIKAYAEKYNLPLINISLTHQRELKGLPPLNGKTI